MKKILCIAGSDSLSGGGLQADIRTFEEYGVNSLHVVTCIVTLAPFTNNVSVSVYEVSEKMLKAQLDSCFNSYNDLSAIKIGMLADLRTAKIVADYLKRWKDIPIILDPVLALKENGNETKREIITFFKDELLPLATITTPNLREAELLSGIEPINNIEQMKLAAKKIRNTGVENVVIKGGQRLSGDVAIDVFYDDNDYLVLKEKKIANDFNNGAGCTFASAIASDIAIGMPIKQSVIEAKEYVYESILNGIPLIDGLGNVYQQKIKEKNSFLSE